MKIKLFEILEKCRWTSSFCFSFALTTKWRHVSCQSLPERPHVPSWVFSKYRFSSCEHALLRLSPFPCVTWLSYSLWVSLFVCPHFLFALYFLISSPITSFIFPQKTNHFRHSNRQWSIIYIIIYWVSIKKELKTSRSAFLRVLNHPRVTLTELSGSIGSQNVRFEICLDSWWRLRDLLFLRKLQCIFGCGETPSTSFIHFDCIGLQKLQSN